MAAENLAAEQDLRREAIDTLSVMAVHWTYESEPPIDVGDFVSNVTGIEREEVDTRLSEITGEEDGLLRRSEKSGRLLINRDNEQAETVTRNFSQTDIIVGNKELSVRGLERLLEDFQKRQRALNAAAAEQKAFGKGMSFEPGAPVQKRGYIEKTAEHLGIAPGQPVPIQGRPVMIHARRQQQ